MKFDRKPSNSRQDLPPQSQRNQYYQNRQVPASKCKRCNSVPRKLKPSSGVIIAQKKIPKQNNHNSSYHHERTHSKRQSKSMHEDFLDLPFENEYLANIIKQKKQMKRQSNSYSKLGIDKSTLDEESTILDNFFEQKYKQSKNELQRENNNLKDKNLGLEKDSQQAIKKAIKYKQIARNLKLNLDSTTASLENVKKISYEEIKNLSNSVSLLEKIVNQRSIQYATNLKTIQSYLQKIQKMIVQSDHNYSFNSKLLADLIDLCLQFQKMAFEEDESMKESLITNQYLNDKELELVFSQTTYNDSEKQQNIPIKSDLSLKTKKLINDYEKLKFESERLRKENKQLKSRNDTIQLQPGFSTQDEIANANFQNINFHSKQSKQSERVTRAASTENHQNQQSLSVNDLLQYDSVQKLNEKLEEKNQYLEDQILLMRKQMNDLTDQTKNLFLDREVNKEQFKHRRDHLISITEYKEGEDSMATEKFDPNNIIYKNQQFLMNEQEAQTKKFYQNLQQSQDDIELTDQKKSPNPLSSDCQDSLDYQYPLQSYDNRIQNNTQRLQQNNFPPKYTLKPSNSTTNIDSSRSAYSKITSTDGSRNKNNIFKRNYLESDKENLTSARGLENKSNNILPYYQDNTSSNNRPSPFVLQTISATSPSIFDANNKKRQNKKHPGNDTFRNPMSMGSTSTMVINEKAKALKEEISTLDEEILQLQNNLKRAMKKK